MKDVGWTALSAAPLAVLALPAVFGGWAPWQLVALAGVAGAAGAAVAWAWAWHAAQVRRAELAAYSADDLAARQAGEAVGRCGRFLPPDRAQELWAAFAALPPDGRRAMGLAVAGLLAQTDDIGLISVGDRLLAVAHGFRSAAEATTPEPAGVA